MPITFDVVSWNLDQGEVYNITMYVIVCQWLTTGEWFSLGPPLSSTNKTNCHDITEIVLKVALNTIKQTNIIGQGGRCVCHFQQYFSYLVTVSFIGGGKWSTRRKPFIVDYGGWCVWCHFQQYFSYIMMVILLLMEESRIPGKTPPFCQFSLWQSCISTCRHDLESQKICTDTVVSQLLHTVYLQSLVARSLLNT